MRYVSYSVDYWKSFIYKEHAQISNSNPFSCMLGKLKDCINLHSFVVYFKHRTLIYNIMRYALFITFFFLNSVVYQSSMIILVELFI